MRYPRLIGYVGMSAATGAYGPELSVIHDKDFDWAAMGASDLLLDELHARSMSSGLVVDLGCGSGVLARRLTDPGYDVVGVELSPHMLAIARRAAPRARFVEGSVFDYKPPSCIAITAIGEVLNYRFDEQSSWPALRRVFKRVQRCARSRGPVSVRPIRPGSRRPHRRNPEVARPRRVLDALSRRGGRWP